VLEALLRSNADTGARDNRGYTVAHVAAQVCGRVNVGGWMGGGWGGYWDWGVCICVCTCTCVFWGGRADVCA